MTCTPNARRNRTVPDQTKATPVALLWVSDAEPGYRRVKHGGQVHYLDPHGQRLRDEAALARIRKLAIPPAYEDVWICMQANGHLQATGRDARGRKQYRYHPQWQQQRGDDKFEAMRAFGAALPRIRRQVQRDLAAHDGRRPTRTLVLATLVRLLDTTFIRIGNEEYARGNGSYGLTTRVAAVVRRCKALPGQELFQYADAEGGVHKVSSSDVNDYLSQVAGTHVTAKDFRTWHGSVMALEFTRLACAGERVPGAAKQVIAQVAARLRNTVAVCRKSYIHPKVLELGAALGDDAARSMLLEQRWAKAAVTSAARALSAAERRLLALLGPDSPRRSSHRQRAPAPRLDRRGICRTPSDRPVADAPRRQGHVAAAVRRIDDPSMRARPSH